MSSDYESEQVGPLRNSVELILPPPEKLEGIAGSLPECVVAILNGIAKHNSSDITELAQLIPDELRLCSFPAELVSLNAPKEVAYDEYFRVGRSVQNPSLCLALSFLRSLRAAAANASLGHDLEPAALADLLKSIRVTADIIVQIGARVTETAAEEQSSQGTWPNGPW